MKMFGKNQSPAEQCEHMYNVYCIGSHVHRITGFTIGFKVPVSLCSEHPKATGSHTLANDFVFAEIFSALTNTAQNRKIFNFN